MSDHVLPVKTYLKVFGALMALTFVTTWIAYYDLGVMNDVVALGIATVKATLVVLYFMHVRYSGRLIWLFSVAGIFWLLILIALVLADLEARLPIVGWGG